MLSPFVKLSVANKISLHFRATIQANGAQGSALATAFPTMQKEKLPELKMPRLTNRD